MKEILFLIFCIVHKAWKSNFPACTKEKHSQVCKKDVNSFPLSCIYFDMKYVLLLIIYPALYTPVTMYIVNDYINY